jgi:hypothetical protein
MIQRWSCAISERYRERTTPQLNSLVKLDADAVDLINVYLNAKKPARLRVPSSLPERRLSQVQVCTTSPVRALVFYDRSQRSCFDEMQDR